MGNRKKMMMSVGLAVLMGAAALSFADSNPPIDIIPYKKAHRIALRARPGKLKDFQLELKNKKWIYYFSVLGSDAKLHEVDVDAVTGKVLMGKAPLVKAVIVKTPKPTPVIP